MSDWIDQIEKALLPEPDKIPPGWFSAMKYAEAKGVDITGARLRLNKGVKQGGLEVKIFKQIAGGRFVSVRFYRIAPAGNKTRRKNGHVPMTRKEKSAHGDKVTNLLRKGRK